MTVTCLMTVATTGPTLSNITDLQGYILENTLHTKETAQKETHHGDINTASVLSACSSGANNK